MRWKGLLLLCGILAWFNCGIENFRTGNLGDIPQNPSHLFTPPWLPLRAYVSRNGDERYYWEVSRLVLGEEPDWDYLADKRQGDRAQDKLEIASRIRPGPSPRFPYRDFPLEYPPLPLALMLLPRAVASTLPAYRLAYGVCAALIWLLACALGAAFCRGLGARAPALPWRRLAIFTLALGPIVVGRFDCLPAALVAGALLLLARGREAAAGVCAGAAILAKLYPALLMLPWLALLWTGRSRKSALRFGAATAATVLVLSAPFLWLAPDGFLRSTFLYGARPLQIESLIGALAALIGGKAAISGAFGSFNAVVPSWLSALAAGALPLALIAFTWAAAKKRLPLTAERLALWTCATICLILPASKVLSPQFLIWLLPFAALLSRRIFGWAVAAAVLTQLYYPFLYDFFVEDGSRWVALVVVMRNFVLVILAFTAVRESLYGVNTHEKARA